LNTITCWACNFTDTQVNPMCFSLRIFLYDLTSLSYMKREDGETPLLQLLGPAPGMILISLFFLLLIYLLAWRLGHVPQVFGYRESSRSRRRRFVASATITSVFLAYLFYLLSQSDLIQSPMKYVVPFLLTGVLLVPIFIDLTKQCKAL